MKDFANKVLLTIHRRDFTRTSATESKLHHKYNDEAPWTPHKKTWIRMKEAANCKMETNCFASFINLISIYPAVKMVFRPFLQMEDIFWHSTKSQDVSWDARRKYGTCESKTSETDRWQYQLRYTSYRIYTVCGWKCPWTTGVNTHTHTLCSACINSPHW